MLGSDFPDALSDPTEIPPLRKTGVAIPLSHCVPAVSQTIAATPPFLSVSQAKDRPNKGGIAEKLASEAHRAAEGVARNSIANRAIVGH